MSEIRLVFAGLPQMLSEIIRNAAGATKDLKVVDERGTLAELAEAAHRSHPHVLVVGSADGRLPSECVPLMYESPHTGTVTITDDGTRTTAFRLVPRGEPIENASAGQIIEAIRELKTGPWHLE